MVEQLTIQPFFDSLGHGCGPHAPAVNAAATARMERILSSPVDAPGRGILLRAPRAGFGKSHLLAHVQERLGTTHEFLPILPLDGSRIDAAGAIENALRRLTRPLPAGGGLTPLDLLARRLFSIALQPLVSSGEVPCQDREVALAALRQRPVETFDFHHSQAVTAHWTKENFEVLGPRLALELSRRTGTSLGETSFWLASLFRFAVATPDHPGRTGMILQSAVADSGVGRYAAFLALLSLIGRVVVVADDLEGMHADPSAALRFASFVAAVRQEAPRVDLVVSVNDDIWDSAFKPALSGGLQDRLGELEIRLEPLDEDALGALLEVRMPDRFQILRGKLALESGDLYARQVLRKAAELDDRGEPAASPGAGVPSQVPPVVVPAAAPALAEPGFESRPESATPRVSTGYAGEGPAAATPQGSSHGDPLVEPGQGFADPELPEDEDPPADPAGGGDRIDDLLRQFRERYGRE
jgi:hypothetical protein